MEPEVGKLFTFPDGTTGYYLGGDVNAATSWSDKAPVGAAKPTGAQRMDAAAKQMSQMHRGDVPLFDRGQLLTALGMAAPLAVPEMAGVAGVAARIGANAAGGALMGGAESGMAGVKGGTEAGAAAGALGEVAAPVLRVAARATAERGARLADWLKQAADAPDWSSAMDKVKSSLLGVQNTLYKPIEDTKVMTPELQAVLNKLKDKNWFPESLESGQTPTVGQLQTLRAKMRKVLGNSTDLADTGLLKQFEDALGQAEPRLETADKAYFQEQQQRRAMVMGARNARKSGAEIEQAAKNFGPDYQQSFRAGVVHRWATSLAQNSERSTAAMGRLMDAGPETQRVFRTMFPDDKSYALFMQEVKSEKSAMKVQAAFKKYAVTPMKWLAQYGVPAGIGAAVGAKYGASQGQNSMSEQP